jgi:hypothetical protein
MSDPETRPSVGKDVHQDPGGKHPPPAPDNTRPNATPPPSYQANPDGYADQSSMNKQNPDQQQNRGERPHVQQEQDESIRKAEIRKAAEEDRPDPTKGQENTQWSGKT